MIHIVVQYLMNNICVILNNILKSYSMLKCIKTHLKALKKIFFLIKKNATSMSTCQRHIEVSGVLKFLEKIRKTVSTILRMLA